MDLLNNTTLPKKVKLSGSDCFHLVLDKHARHHHAGDNVMRIVFYFDEMVSLQKTTEALQQSPIIYWLCNIKLVQGFFFHSPYWKYKDAQRNITITEHTHPAEDEIPASVLNRDIPVTASRFIECDIIYYPSNHSAIVLSWNHILMDGRGISMLINHLNNKDRSYKNAIETLFPAPEKKQNIFSYISNMYEVKSFIQTSSALPISSVANKEHKSVPYFNNTIIYFTAEETQQIDDNAFNSGARFGGNLFYLSCCAHVINKHNRLKNKEGVLWLPIPYDGRLKGSSGPIISNFVAYLFYRIPQEELTDLKQTVNSLHKQMARQLKIEMPRKYNMLLKMMRRIPVWLYYFLVNRTGEGSFASFLYSSTGNNFNTMTSLFDVPVRNITIFPSSTFPPGLTFSFLKHADALNINIAYSPDIVSNIELDLIKNGIKDLLLKN